MSGPTRPMAGHTGQLALGVAPSCKVHRCTAQVAGSSITGEGHVCGAHNETEWGAALVRSPDPYYRKLGAALRRDAAVHSGGTR